MIAQKSKSVSLVLFILAAISLVKSMPQGTPARTSVFSDIDITNVAGTGAQVKVAADRVCGSDLSADELVRRHGLGNAAELEFFNPLVLDAFFNEPLKKALNCQKNRNKVMKDSCELQWAIKTNNQCEITDNTQQIADNIASVDRTCTGADASLFVNATEITEPAPRSTEDCGAESNETFTSTFNDVNITKTPGLGAEAIVAAESVCAKSLSNGELGHRAKLGSTANSSTFTPAITAAASNAPLLKALNCQKERNNIMIAQCTRERAVKREKDFNIQEETLKLGQSVDLANSFCDGVDASLFI